MSGKSNDARKVKEFAISTYTKGFVASNTIDNILTQEFFQFQEIHQIIHYKNVGVELVLFNGKRRVFYNDLADQSVALYNSLNNSMISWMNSRSN